MDNIENSIRHLQGSIKRRAMNISYAAQEVADFKFYMKTWSKTVNKTARTEINYTTAKCRLAKLVRQQKTEKKMLAMMYILNRRVHNKHTVYNKYTDRHIREYCVILDCL